MEIKTKIENFLISELSALSVGGQNNHSSLEDEVCRLLFHRNFRKFPADDATRSQIRNTVKDSIKNKIPIRIIHWQGCYKLWKYEEHPECDWGELFFLMYCIAYLKPILEIYKHGVIFEIFLDDFILPRLNNISKEAYDDYFTSLTKLVEFIKQFTPKNLEFKFTRSISIFENEEHAWQEVENALSAWQKPEEIELPDWHKVSINLSCRVTDEMCKDPLWQEKNAALHDSYLDLVIRIYDPVFSKSVCITPIPWPEGGAIAIGTTRNSIMKHWVAVGALKNYGDRLSPVVLSQSQLDKYKFNFSDVDIKGLDGKNFKRIRVVKMKE